MYMCSCACICNAFNAGRWQHSLYFSLKKHVNCYPQSSSVIVLPDLKRTKFKMVFFLSFFFFSSGNLTKPSALLQCNKLGKKSQ